MDKNPYQSLINVSSRIEKMLKLRKEKGVINNFNIERVPDDNKLVIVTYCR